MKTINDIKSKAIHLNDQATNIVPDVFLPLSNLKHLPNGQLDLSFLEDKIKTLKDLKYFHTRKLVKIDEEDRILDYGEAISTLYGNRTVVSEKHIEYYINRKKDFEDFENFEDFDSLEAGTGQKYRHEKLIFLVPSSSCTAKNDPLTTKLSNFFNTQNNKETKWLLSYLSLREEVYPDTESTEYRWSPPWNSKRHYDSLEDELDHFFKDSFFTQAPSCAVSKNQSNTLYKLNFKSNSKSDSKFIKLVPEKIKQNKTKIKDHQQGREKFSLSSLEGKETKTVSSQKALSGRHKRSAIHKIHKPCEKLKTRKAAVICLNNNSEYPFDQQKLKLINDIQEQERRDVDHFIFLPAETSSKIDHQVICTFLNRSTSKKNKDLDSHHREGLVNRYETYKIKKS